MDYLVLVGKSFLILLTAFVLISLAQVLFYFLAKYNHSEELRKNNLAVGIKVSGYFLAIVLIISGACFGESLGFLKDLQEITLYSSLGILLLLFSGFLNDKIILYKFDNTKEIIKDQNIGTATVIFSTYIASGLIVAGSITGQGGGVLTLLTFFMLGQIALVLFSKIYDLITKYDLHREIEKDNIAVGVSFSGMIIAFGIILFKGVSGDFTDWYLDLTNFSIEVIAGILILPVFRILFDKVLIPKIDLDQELSAGNVAVGFLEAVIMISVALVYFFSVDLSISF